MVRSAQLCGATGAPATKRRERPGASADGIVDDYLYDIFVSYRHRGPALSWLQRHFYPMLDRWLPNTLNRDPSIFVDWNLETGSAWPDALAVALKSSRCMLAVWSPEYFNSAWCRAEWESFLARERHIGRDGLIYPIQYFDGDRFPDEAKRRVSKDLRDYNCPERAFSRTRKYVRLDALAQEICVELAGLVEAAPAFRTDWPLVLPYVPPAPDSALPRLG